MMRRIKIVENIHRIQPGRRGIAPVMHKQLLAGEDLALGFREMLGIQKTVPDILVPADRPAIIFGL